MAAERRYGSWPSPLPVKVGARGTRTFGPIEIDDRGSVLWLERRPDENGRGVIVRAREDGSLEELTPSDHDVRTTVHEYGGGDFAVADDRLWYARAADQRLYRLTDREDPTPVTPAPIKDRSHRYADLEPTADGDRLYCVRERHLHDGPSSEQLVSVDEGDVRVVAEEHDFYAAPRVSPATNRIAWLTWDRPQMPWDGTELHVARYDETGALHGEQTVLGGPDESVFDPTWGPDGTLYAVSDRSGWWNIYRIAGGSPIPVYQECAEFGVPQWAFGLSTIAPLEDGRLAAIRTCDGEQHLGLVEVEQGRFDEQPLPFTTYNRPKLATDGSVLAFLAGSPACPTSVVRWRPGGNLAVLRSAFRLEARPAFVSRPERLTVPTPDGEEPAHTLFYPPRNPDVEPADDDAPPLIVMPHSGPTEQAFPTLDPEIQLFTSRGFAVAVVNFRGSSGYGRTYRNRLTGRWGVIDVEDTVRTATHLVETGRVDPDRIAVRGSSAAGFTALTAVVRSDIFDACVSVSGVSDLETLRDATHRFESHYLDTLVGPYPDAVDEYRDRSPVTHADRIDCPVLLCQGLDDPVVPPSQTRSFVTALDAESTPYMYVAFEDEPHSFRRSSSRRRALEAELAFYADAFGIELADDVPDAFIGRESRQVIVRTDGSLSTR